VINGVNNVQGKSPEIAKNMKTKCPFCNEPYDIDLEHLERHLECFKCHNKFECKIVAVPQMGTMYMDIETTDDSIKPQAEISTIVWWCNNKWYSWVNGKDKPDEFILFWENAPWVVTFNGKAIEEPLLCRQFNVSPHKKHIELRAIAKKKGISGGLKALGEVFELPCPVGIDKLDSDTAIRLWKLYAKDQSPKAIQNLLYCSAWSVVLTYHLHCHFSKAHPIPMQNQVPFSLDPNYMKLTRTQAVKTVSPDVALKKPVIKKIPAVIKPSQNGSEIKKTVISTNKKVAKPEKKILIKKK
jgi:uncharacterized protein YprB with RNaseH-like and TPR domain